MYSISFKKYLYKEDNKTKSFDNLEKSAYKKALKWLRDSFLCDCQDALQSIGIHKPIYDNNTYSFLFNNLPPDVELYELVLNDANRLFYYIGDNETIYIRLFTAGHLQINKQKR